MGTLRTHHKGNLQAPKRPTELAEVKALTAQPTPEAVVELLKRLRDAETRLGELERAMQKYGLR